MTIIEKTKKIFFDHELANCGKRKERVPFLTGLDYVASRDPADLGRPEGA